MTLPELRPQPGPQSVFASTTADVAFYGGAAGSGKSFIEVLDVARYAYVPGFSAVYFRRTYPQLSAPDGLWDLSLELLPSCGATPHWGDLEWSLPGGGRVLMRHLQHEKNRFDHQGAQYCGIYFDELTQFTESQFWYLLSRNRSVCGVRPYIRGTCNPDPDSFVCRMIDWYLDDNGDPISERSGVLRWFARVDGRSEGSDGLVWGDSAAEVEAKAPGAMPLSFTFIAARLEDNPALLKRDPGYRARLQNLHHVERARLLGGNWKVRPAAGSYFKRHYFPVFDVAPGAIQRSVRGWDKAATEVSASSPDPDWTRGVRLALLSGDAPVKYLITDIAGGRYSPGGVDTLMRNTASQDGRETTQACFIDPGQAGKVDEAHVRSVLDGYRVRFERASKSKETYAGPVSSQAEGGRIGLLRGAWNDSFLAEAEAFPEGPHDDMVDALSLAYLRLTGGQSRRAGAGGADGRSKWRH
jgi:predicted phage terminase large subunit-like protein